MPSGKEGGQTGRRRRRLGLNFKQHSALWADFASQRAGERAELVVIGVPGIPSVLRPLGTRGLALSLARSLTLRMHNVQRKLPLLLQVPSLTNPQKVATEKHKKEGMPGTRYTRICLSLVISIDVL